MTDDPNPTVCTSQPLVDVAIQPSGKRWQVDTPLFYDQAMAQNLSEMRTKQRERFEGGIRSAQWTGKVSAIGHAANQRCVMRLSRLRSPYRVARQDIDTVIEQEYGEHADTPSKDEVLRDDRDRMDIPGRLVVVGDNL